MARPWHAFFPRFYRLLRVIEPLLRRWLRLRGIRNTVQLTVRGRRSGAPRRVLLGLLRVDGRPYLGHPDGHCAWTLNLEAAGRGHVAVPGRGDSRVIPTLLPAGPERDAVIRATFRQHPFPGNVLYWLARDHIRDAGRFYRLDVTRTRDDDRAGEPRSTAA
jgi:deazaflavin-dependent oxidoreductase (nitroreductase family)